MQRRPRKPLLVFAVVALCGGIAASPAAGQDPETTTTWRDDTLVVTAATPGTLALTTTPGAPYDGPLIHCGWFDLEITSTTVDLARPTTPTVGDTYVYNCWYTDPWADRYPGYPIVAVFDPVVDPPGPVVTTPDAARFAVDSIRFEPPAVRTAPPAAHVVGVPSWFAVTSELDYAPASAQAGPVWATVRPVFRDATWTLGDGEPLVCTADATTLWDPEGPDGQSSDCAHAFESVPEASGAASVTIAWTVWQQTDRTGGDWVVWGTVQLTSPLDLTVVELQAAIN
jgi:hypothetical protein